MKHAEKQQKSQYRIKSSDKTALAGFDQKQAFFDSMHESKSFNKHPVSLFNHRNLSVTSVTIDKWYGYGHLMEIVVRRADQKLYKFMEGDFPRLHLNDIEDMLLLVKRVEDLQHRVKSYQKKLNISKPRTRDVDLTRRTPYTTLSEPQGVLYEDKLKRKRLMHTVELYKFSDGTLTSVCNTLDQMLKNLRLWYNKAMKRRKWTITDQKRSHIMIKDINQQLLERRIMRSLGKFVGRRDYGTDPRLL
ncbi:hypothetical protein Tco_0024463 [Tanacetum coccineum]